MGLNEQQKQAVEYLDGPLLVLAGPGTGKTQLLSHKVEYILKNTDTNPENILCLTFTDSGASNMRERLKSTIKDAALKVNIGTYHSFGGDILAQYKNYAPEYDRRLDSVIDEVAKYKIVKQIQDSLPGTDILRGDKIKDIISVIGEAKSANLSAPDLAKIAEQNISDSEMISREVAPLLANVVARAFKDSYEKAYLPIFAILQQFANEKPIMPSVERIAAILARELNEAITEAESTQKIKPLSSWKEKFFEKNEYGEYRLKDRVANLKLKSLAHVMQRYQDYLLENGLYDFDDMIQEAIKALRDDDGFRMTMQEKYQFIMLDEFQDTNPAQLSIVQALTDYERPMVMAVGDSDQAIYEFQGALSSNMLDFQRYYNANVIPLIDNYRSTQEILDFSHKIIAQAPDRQMADNQLIAHKPDPDSTQIFRYEFLGADSECGFIAQKIAELVKSGVPQNEIAVISYKRKYFEPLLPYLKAYPELKIAYEKRDNLFDDEKCHELLTILRYVYEVANEQRVDIPMVEILSFPCFDLPVLAILKVADKARREKKSALEVAASSEVKEVREIAELLMKLAGDSFTEPLIKLMSPIIDRIDANIHDEYERFKFYENLASLIEAVKNHFSDSRPLRLKELVGFMNDYELAEAPLAVKSPYREADEAVQIMSAHKAKGLEFEHVFVISADDAAWGKGGGNNNLLTLPKNLTQIRHTGMSDGERLRILYVAFTRAKQALYITNAKRDFGGRAPKRLEYFKEFVEKDDDDNEIIKSPLIPSGKVTEMYDLPSIDVREENLRNWIRPFVALTPDMQAFYADQLKNWRMSATKLTSFIDVVYGGPQEFFKSTVLRAPSNGDTEAMAFGNLIHATFEAVTNRKISDEEAVEMFLSGAKNCDLSDAEIKHLCEKGPHDLAISLTEFKGVLRQGKAEVDFAPEHLTISGVPVTGKIDHMILDEQNKTIEIYDFKTAKYSNKKWSSDVALYKYMLQLVFYKLLLNNSPRYTNYKVTKAHILFVTPDKDGEVHDKLYEFNEADEKILRRLIVAVYNLVSDLSFLNDVELMIEPDRTRGMKELREFIELVLAKGERR